MVELSSHQRDAIARQMVASVFMLLDRETNEFGCGIFFRRGDRHYVLSATHVLESVMSGSKRVLMPERPPSNDPTDLVPLGAGEVVFTEKNQGPTDEDPYGEDVAAYRLSDEVARRFRANGWVFLTDEDVYTGPLIGECLIVGWPCANVAVTRNGGQSDLAADPVFLRTAPIPPPSDAKQPIRREFFLAYPEGAPSAKGVSGAPVWGAVDLPIDALWAPTKQFKLVGTQHAARNQTYLRATLWGAVDAMLTSLEAGAVPHV